LGAIFALFLQRSGKTGLSTVARSNYDVVRNQGMLIPPSTVGEGGVNEGGVVKFEHVFRALSSSTTPEAPAPMPEFSYILVATKALTFAKPSLVESLEPYVTPGKSTIVLIQNGIGIEDALQARWPDNLIITCVSYIGGEQKSPGVVIHQGGTLLTAGPFRGGNLDSPVHSPANERERLDRIAEMLRDGGCNVETLHDPVEMQVNRWRKLAWNVAWNGLTGLTNLDTDAFFASSPYAAPLAVSLMDEITLVARAKGYEIDPLAPECPLPADEKAKLAEKMGLSKRLGQTFYETMVKRGPTTSSMRADVNAGRVLEAEVIYGQPLKYAKELGIRIPMTETVAVLVSAVDARNDGRVKAVA
ncbi:hypothetical protein DL93DRAFT_2055033, partial [Clavulina sp. PMI_390]